MTFLPAYNEDLQRELGTSEAAIQLDLHAWEGEHGPIVQLTPGMWVSLDGLADILNVEGAND